MARIYTRGGDDGTTALLNGRRVSKASPPISALGAIDELNSALGLARSLHLPRRLEPVLTGIQRDLFRLGASQLTNRDVTAVEKLVDSLQTELPPLREFILPGGVPAAAALQLARTVCRRAERECVRSALDPLAVPYLNRLGDLLFVMARWVNRRARGKETKWRG